MKYSALGKYCSLILQRTILKMKNQMADYVCAAHILVEVPGSDGLALHRRHSQEAVQTGLWMHNRNRLRSQHACQTGSEYENGENPTNDLAHIPTPFPRPAIRRPNGRRSYNCAARLT